MQRAHPALVAGVEGGEQLADLGAAHLADDEPVGPHPQRLAHEVDEGDPADALDVGPTTLQPHDVGVRRGRARGRPRRPRPARRPGTRRPGAASTVVLPAPVPPVTTSEARAATTARSSAAMSGVTAPSRTRASTPTGPVPGEPQAEVRPAVGERRQHGVQPHATRQHPVDPRLGVVEPAAGDPGQPHGERPQVVEPATRTARPLDALPAVDPDRAVTVDEQVGDRPVGGQLRQRAQARPAARAARAPRRRGPSSPRVAGVLGHEASIGPRRRRRPGRGWRARTEASSGPGPRGHDATARRVDRRDHGIRAPAHAVTAGAGEQPALGVAGHVRVVGEVVQVGDAEVGDDLVDDVGAGRGRRG